MGFYGNITDTSHTHFQFDKIFPNRVTMESAAALGIDDVFAGRFVLVKYEPEEPFFVGDFLCGYIRKLDKGNEQDRGILSEAGLFESPDDFYVISPSSSYSSYYRFTRFELVESPVEEDWIKYFYKFNKIAIKKLPSKDYFIPGKQYYTTDASFSSNLVCPEMIIQERDLSSNEPVSNFYKIMDIEGYANNKIAIAEKIILDANGSYGAYLTNYQIDKQTYTQVEKGFDPRGYDATVWEKVYSEGEGKFIFIARLSATMPGLQLVANPPSFAPFVPYIDGASSDALYRIHVPSQWGLQIKKADSETTYDEEGKEVQVTYPLSDQDVQRNVYKTALGSAEKLKVDHVETIPGEIYFYKDGFNKLVHSEPVENIVNELLLTPSGESGLQYPSDEGNSSQKDILELAVHLPAIGEMVSNTYDELYGYDEETGKRYTDIKWYNGDQKELIDLGDTSLGGKTKDLQTLAGTINTFHDRLGQIIVPLDKWVNPEDENYDAWVGALNGKDFIYSYRSDPEKPVQYYRLDEEQYYTDVDTGTFKYVKVELDSSSYQPNTYYYLDIQNGPNEILEGTADAEALQIALSGNFLSNYTYYKKSIADIKFTEVDLETYQPHKYFLKDGTTYIRDNGDAPSNIYGSYYTIDETYPNLKTYEPNDFNDNYSQNKFYTKSANKDYLLAREELPNGFTQYYSTSTRDFALATQVIFYQPRRFYYKYGNEGYRRIDANTYEEFKESMSGYFENGKIEVYWLEFESDPIITAIPVETVDEEGNTIIETQTYLSYPVKAAHYVNQFVEIIDAPNPEAPEGSAARKRWEEMVQTYTQMIDILGMGLTLDDISLTLYCKSIDDYPDWIALENAESVTDLTGTPAYAIPRSYYYVVPFPVKLYIPGRYYSRRPNGSETGDYYINWEPLDFQNHTLYYTIEEILPVTKQFYVPNAYWYYSEEENNYILDKNPYSSPHEGTHYEKQKLYVYNDASGRCPVGYEWNEDSLYIPASITLKSMKKRLTLLEIEGINNGLSSIHGAILNLARQYSPNNQTRDTTTFRGGLNKLQDYLYGINKLVPGKILYVNDFGQITSGDISYSQLKSLIH